MSYQRQVSVRRFVRASGDAAQTSRLERRREFMRKKQEKEHAEGGAPYIPRALPAFGQAQPGWTLNGALSHVSSEDALVNLYFRLVPGILPHDAQRLIVAAYSASPLGLLRLAFDVRNCRGGKGRRQLFYFVSDFMLCGAISTPLGDAQPTTSMMSPLSSYSPSSSSSSSSSLSVCLPSSQAQQHHHFDRRRAEEWLFNLKHVAHYGYFKDLWALFESAKRTGFPSSSSCKAAKWIESSLQTEVIEIFAAQLEKDCQRVWNVTPADYHASGIRMAVPQGETTPSISLAAKYAPTSGKRFDKSLGVTSLLCQRLGLSARSYRWMVSDMRAIIDVVERRMSAGEWSDIDLSKLPSVALLRSRQALQRHLPEQWKEFKERVRAGETKVNVAQIAPYELVKVLMDKHDDDLELLLGEYIRKHGTTMKNVAVVADTSGSMTCGAEPRPIDVCMALTLLAAENAEGAMAKRYFAFSSSSQELVIQGATYHDKLRHAMSGPWGGSTNVQAVFAQILEKMKAGQDIRTVMIISDMQFDTCGSRTTNFDAIEASFKAAGIARPVLVFWNVSALGSDFPVKADTNGTILVSGCSPSLFQMIVDAPDNVSPSMFVRSIIDKPDYARIQLPPSDAAQPDVQDDTPSTVAAATTST